MHKLGLIVALCAATLSTAAIAADWVLVSLSADGALFYIDRESIRKMPSGYKRAWATLDYDKPSSSGVTKTIALQEFDCPDGRSRTLQLTYYKGQEVKNTDNDAGEWSYVTPGTLSESAFDYVCFGKLD